ncbi:hypothetical protein ABZW10_38305 [Kitasatospora sp. NPDC004723]|uniref:hypothetical protein n=1 Tax=Kitasatospora sp. NPDC004723 TaxID=3154288 RepID=UPI0033AF1075
MNAKTRVAVIGAGWAGGLHMEGFRRAGADLVGVFSRTRSRAERLAARGGVGDGGDDEFVDEHGVGCAGEAGAAGVAAHVAVVAEGFGGGQAERGEADDLLLAARIQQLEKRLSQALGARAWQESGLGAPADIDELQRKLTRLEQHNVELTSALEDARSDLDAAREANRDLTRALTNEAESATDPVRRHVRRSGSIGRSALPERM